MTHLGLFCLFLSSLAPHLISSRGHPAHYSCTTRVAPPHLLNQKATRILELPPQPAPHHDLCAAFISQPSSPLVVHAHYSCTTRVAPPHPLNISGRPLLCLSHLLGHTLIVDLMLPHLTDNLLFRGRHVFTPRPFNLPFDKKKI